MFTVGTRVVFSEPSMSEKFGSGPFTVTFSDITGIVRLEGVQGSFQEHDLLDARLTKVFNQEQPSFSRERENNLSSRMPGIPDVQYAIGQLLRALPAASVIPPENGFKDESFYRFPVIRDCFCGCPVRETLDGRRCENGHNHAD
jgi:hypothetical protein